MVHTRGQQAGAVSPANPGSSSATGNSVAFQAANVASFGLKNGSNTQSLHLSGTPVEVPLVGDLPAAVPLLSMPLEWESRKGRHALAPKWGCLPTQMILSISGWTRTSLEMSTIRDMV